MNKLERERVVYYSKSDMMGGYFLSKSENILNDKCEVVINNINDAMELYHIKLYIDNEVYLKKWTNVDVDTFKGVVKKFGTLIGEFISRINNDDFIAIHEELISDYEDSFWLSINNLKTFKKLSRIK